MIERRVIASFLCASEPACVTSARSASCRGALLGAALVALALVALAPSACEGGRGERAAAPSPPPLAPTATQAPEHAGSQDDLANALDLAADSVTAGVNEQVRRAWRGKTVRWQVTRVPALCGDADACYVQPFASARRGARSAHGWLPEVRFAAGERERMLAACASLEACAITLEATLGELVVSDEQPTSVRLDQARLVGAARAPG